MNPTNLETRPSSRPQPLTDAVVMALAEAMRGIRYGTVTAIIQDGQVVQIDRTERRRLKSDTP